ncbi:MAG: hypothetical protein J0I06_05570 [Planctomycetes bacterium]|nr:hypothetical protein [Planctomycetota bacterium]
MNMQYVLLAWLFALCAVTGGFRFVETPVVAGLAQDEKSKAREFPLAPAPREKKTTAELLVGTWTVVEIDGKAVPNNWILATEFTAKGEVHIFIDDKKNVPRVRIGVYKFQAGVVQIDFPYLISASLQPGCNRSENSWPTSLRWRHG